MSFEIATRLDSVSRLSDDEYFTIFLNSTCEARINFCQSCTSFRDFCKTDEHINSCKMNLKTREGVNTVAFSPDGELLASGNDERGVEIWNVKTAECIKSFKKCHSLEVNSVVFSSNGEWLATGSKDEFVKIWKVSTGECIKIFDCNSCSFPRMMTHAVNSVDFSPNDDWIASGDDNGDVKIWNVNESNEKRKRRLPNKTFRHTKNVNSVNFSPKGEWLASGSSDKTVKIWNIKTEDCKTFEGHNKGVNSVVFSPDGECIASGDDNGDVKIWNVNKGTCINTFKYHENSVSVDFSPDGEWIASGSWDSSIKIWKWNAETGECEKTLKAFDDSPVTSIRFSPNGKRLAVANAGYDKNRFENIVEIFPLNLN